MTAEFPKMLFAPAGKGSVTVRDHEEEAARLATGYTVRPRAVHHEPQQIHAPEAVKAEPLTEAHLPAIVDAVAAVVSGAAAGADRPAPLTVDHVPTIVDAVFDRLKGMAVAATEGESHRDALETIRGEIAGHLAALKADLVGEIRALIAPAPAAKPGKA